jgi:hypothetical protein
MDANTKVVRLYFLTLFCGILWMSATCLLTQQETPLRIAVWWVSMGCFIVLYLWGSAVQRADQEDRR